jgi:hypothetical protein
LRPVHHHYYILLSLCSGVVAGDSLIVETQDLADNGLERAPRVELLSYSLLRINQYRQRQNAGYGSPISVEDVTVVVRWVDHSLKNIVNTKCSSSLVRKEE